MKPYFDAILKKLLKHEGGYSDHPEDRGGATHYGITQATYHAYLKRLGREVQSVKNITMDEVMAIYRAQYQAPIRFDELPAGLDYALFDFAVNSGVSRAVKTLQRLLKVKVDGIVGEITLSQIYAQHPQGKTAELIKALCVARRGFVRRLKHYKTFGRGWERRINEVEQSALELCEYGQFVPNQSFEIQVNESPKAEGAPSLKGAVVTSKSAQAAVVGALGVAVSSIPEAVSMARPAHDALNLPLTHWLGVVLTLSALAYIVYRRLSERDDV